MTTSIRRLLACGLFSIVIVCAGCAGRNDGCRTNSGMTAEMAELDLPVPNGVKLCRAEIKSVMFEIKKDSDEVQSEFRAKLEKAGWKETPNPATGLLEWPTGFFVKDGRQIRYKVETCAGSFLSGLLSSCSTISIDEVTK